MMLLRDKIYVALGSDHAFDDSDDGDVMCPLLNVGAELSCNL